MQSSLRLASRTSKALWTRQSSMSAVTARPCVQVFHISTRKYSSSESDLVVRNPYTGDVVYQKPYTSLDEAMATLDKTAEAQRIWATLTVEQRIEQLKKGIQYFVDNANQVALDTVACAGKPMTQATGEVASGIAKMEYSCSIAVKELSPYSEQTKDGIQYSIHRVPKGVIDIVAPWNYPVFTAQNGIIPALLAGNAVTLKHESAPLVGEHFEKAFGTFTTPDGREVSGLLSFLNTSIPTADKLLEQGDHIKHRVFTGSVRAGRAIAAANGRRAVNTSLDTPFINMSLELGGSDVAYIHEDADLAAAIPFIVNIGRLHNGGQSCCSVKRLLVHRSVYDQVVEQTKKELTTHRHGDPMDKNTNLSTVFGGESAANGIYAFVEDAHAKGATVHVGGEDIVGGSADDVKSRVVVNEKAGWFIRPTMLTGVNLEMECMNEEVFGSVLPIYPVDSAEEAMAITNDNKYGLTSSVWTTDKSVADMWVSQGNQGTVFVNWCNDVHPQVTWSGVKWSGNGVGAMAKDGFYALTNPRSVVINGM
eukprot:GFYU01015884.1.p1 GENE.GFYU01015884.1~~GFYU01015884.1.p1  ORF type:complete len:588 (-),score=170.01 GFYU01015884.1:512-2116(-)